MDFVYWLGIGGAGLVGAATVLERAGKRSRGSVSKPAARPSLQPSHPLQSVTSLGESPPVPCGLEVNGVAENIVLAPYISSGSAELSFSLSNHAGDGIQGPHFHIGLTSDHLKKLLAQESGQLIDALPLRDFGSIDELRGYPAADLGPHTRRIISLALKVSRAQNGTVFSFEGEADAVEPNSVRYPSPPEKLLGYRFRVVFDIPDKSAQLYIRDAGAQKVIDRVLRWPSEEFSPASSEFIGLP